MQRSQPELEGTSVRINGRTLQIPGYQLLQEVGRGANAVVFEASKIAGISHPLVVSTHSFGNVEDHPFCVMEMVAGVSGKEWIKHNPTTEARLAVWSLYSEALRYIHSSVGIHGDPHLGNLIVSTSFLGVKIVDAGTSEFWADHSKIEAREATLILETASHLFAQEGFNQLWQHPSGLEYKTTLAILQAVAKYLGIVYGLVDWHRRSGNADLLSNLITQNPFFNLEVVFSQIKETGITTENRLASRINARLSGINNVLEADQSINRQTLELYEAAAARSLSLMAKGRVAGSI